MTDPDLTALRELLLTGAPNAVQLQEIWERAEVLQWRGDAALARAFVKHALRLGELLLACDAGAAAVKEHAGDAELLRTFARALAQIGNTARAQDILLALIAGGEADAETRSLLGRTYKDAAAAAREPAGREAALRMALAEYRRAFADEPENFYPGINAATMALLLGEDATAMALAAEVLRGCAGGGDDYWRCATEAEALAILGRDDEARAAYRAAAALAGRNLRDLCSTRRQARLLAVHLEKGRGYFDDCFPALKVVVFSGHMIDLPDRAVPRFPAEAEARVKELIKAKLAEIGAHIGFASAARGADILFHEAMLELGGSVRVILPWSRAEYCETSVALPEDAGGWAARFRAVLARAASVHEIGELHMPSSATGFEFCNLVMNGNARLLARWLDVELQPVALWDGLPGLPGGTSTFVDFWSGQPEGVEIIDLPKPPPPRALPARIPPAVSSPASAENWVRDTVRQEVRTMLFADIVGYSKLPESAIPNYIAYFLSSVSQLVAGSAFAPISVNTWGDAIYFVFAKAEHAGRFALDLTDLIGRTPWADYGLLSQDKEGRSAPLNIRTGLHSGPVYSHFDPIVRKLGYTGAHVSRAARIEPVTKPGKVFASEEFAALAAAEGARGFVCEFIGTQPLAKGYGTFRIYSLARDGAGGGA